MSDEPIPPRHKWSVGDKCNYFSGIHKRTVNGRVVSTGEEYVAVVYSGCVELIYDHDLDVGHTYRFC